MPPVRLSREALAAGKVDSGHAEATGGVYAHFVVPAPVPRVYAVLADDAAMSRWIPHLRRVQVLEEGSPCKRVAFTVSVPLGQVDYQLRRCRDGSRLWWTLAGGDRLKAADGAYALEPFGEGATLVHYWSRVVPAGPIPRGLYDKVAEMGLGALVDGLRAEVARRP
jgi:uncharacterized membrane protein